MSESLPRVVLDTVVFVQALISGRGHSAGCLDRLRKGAFVLLMSDDTFAELRDVPFRQTLRAKYPFITDDEVNALVAEIEAAAVHIARPPAAVELPRDPKDEPFIDLAVAGDARFIVTWNERHLTYLMRQDTPEGKESVPDSLESGSSRHRNSLLLWMQWRNDTKPSGSYRAPYNSFAGPKTLLAEFTLQDARLSSITVPITLNLGLSDVGMSTLAIRDGKDILVQQTITNYGDKPIDYTAFAIVPTQPRQERLITNLAPGRTTIKLYRFPAKSTEKSHVRTGVKELTGNRILNEEVEIQ